jgi:hypothetical protein
MTDEQKRVLKQKAEEVMMEPALPQEEGMNPHNIAIQKNN